MTNFCDLLGCRVAAWLKLFAKKCVFFTDRIFIEKGCENSFCGKNAFFGKTSSPAYCILRRLRKRLHTSIFWGRLPNYFLGISFELSLTSYKRINTVDLSLARINYDLKIFMRETKFVLIYIFLILRSFNGYWSPSLKIPVKPKSADMQWIQTQYRLSLERWKVKWTEFLWVNVFFLFDLPSLVTQFVFYKKYNIV